MSCELTLCESLYHSTTYTGSCNVNIGYRLPMLAIIVKLMLRMNFNTSIFKDCILVVNGLFVSPYFELESLIKIAIVQWRSVFCGNG